MLAIVRTEDEINQILNWACEGKDDGSHYPGMSYEDGLVAMYDWLIGQIDERPDG